MHLSLCVLAFAATFLSSTTALSPNNAITPLKALHDLHEGNNYGGRVLRIHEPVDEDNAGSDEERGGGINNFLNKFRYQSQGAHGAENLNPITMAQTYLQKNPTLFTPMRTDVDKRYNTYAIWRSMKYHSDEVGRAMQLNGYTANEVMAFVKEYQKFQPATLSFT